MIRADILFERVGAPSAAVADLAAFTLLQQAEAAESTSMNQPAGGSAQLAPVSPQEIREQVKMSISIEIFGFFSKSVRFCIENAGFCRRLQRVRSSRECSRGTLRTRRRLVLLLFKMMNSVFKMMDFGLKMTKHGGGCDTVADAMTSSMTSSIGCEKIHD